MTCLLTLYMLIKRSSCWTKSLLTLSTDVVNKPRLYLGETDTCMILTVIPNFRAHQQIRTGLSFFSHFETDGLLFFLPWVLVSIPHLVSDVKEKNLKVGDGKSFLHFQSLHSNKITSFFLTSCSLWKTHSNSFRKFTWISKSEHNNLAKAILQKQAVINKTVHVSVAHYKNVKLLRISKALLRY